MAKYHTLWVTKLGASHLEEAREFPNIEAAVRDLANNYPTSGDEDSDDRIFFPDVDGNVVVLRASRIDHAVVLPEEKMEVRDDK